MPDKTERELKRKFGAYLKVAILNARKEYLIEQNKIIKTEISLDEFEFIKDENAEHMLENVDVYKRQVIPIPVILVCWNVSVFRSDCFQYLPVPFF